MQKSLIKQAYKSMTKKAFKELIHVSIYGRGPHKIIAVYYDWKQGTYLNEDNVQCIFVGYKHMLAFQHVTQVQAIDEAYQRLIKNSTNAIAFPFRHRQAIEDKDRFKVSISFS